MRRLSFPALALLTASLVAGCTTAPDATEPVTDPEDILAASTGTPGPPLPAGSQLEPAGASAAKADEQGELLGSYRPDDKKPQERIPTIVARGRLIVGVDQSNNLLSYRDTLTGQLRGFEVDLAREIARDIFGDPEKVDFRFLTSSERTEAIATGRVDMVIRSMTMTPEREKDVVFSLPYLLTHTRLLVEKGSGVTEISDLDGQTACAAAGSTSVDLIRLRAPKANVLSTRYWGDCLLALQQGQTDAIVTDDMLLSGMQDQDPYTEIVGEALTEEAYAVAIRKPDAVFDSRGLVRQVNSTLLRMRADGSLSSLYNQYFGAYVEQYPLPSPHYRQEK